jgi:ribosomal protein S21
MSNVAVDKTGSENTGSLMRRFTKRVQSAGIIPKVRGNRYYARVKSRTMQRKSALKMLEKREKMQELAKLGKLPETTQRRRR